MPGLASLADANGVPVIARLICDRALEVRSADGTFQTGPAALDELYSGVSWPVSADAGSHPLAQLSRGGVLYAIALARAGATAFAAELYRFGAEPLASGSRPTSRGSVERWLRLDRRQPRGLLADRSMSGFARLPRAAKDPWIRWHRRDRSGGGLRHKVYVSPKTDNLPDVLEVCMQVAVEMGVPSLKVIADPRGAFRPDKLVLYVDGTDEIAAIGAELRRALRGYPALGVPFTAPLGQDGLLSAGIDPTPRQRPKGPASWRLVVADALGKAAEVARPFAGRPAALQFITWRLRLSGIDPEGWTWA